MGVTGLWRLLEPAGKPVPLETLENKVLAVGTNNNADNYYLISYYSALSELPSWLVNFNLCC